MSEPVSTSYGASRRWLWIWLVVYTLLTGALIARVGMNSTPDEAAHLSYVEYLATQNQLPVFQVLSAQENPGGYEFHQPPLYYAVCALGWKLLPPGVENYFCRVVSLLCGLGALVLLWAAVRHLMPTRPELANWATGFAALWPMHQAVGASAGNDAAAGLVCAALFHQIARLSQQKITMRSCVVVGALIGIGLLTKTSCLTVSLAALGALGWWTWQQDRAEIAAGTTPRSTLTPYFAVMLTLIVTIAVGGWWLVRNRFLYGDPFGQSAFNRAFAFNLQTGQGSVGLTEFLAAGVSIGTYFQALLLSMFWTCWGFWGGPESARGVVNPFTGAIREQMLAPVLPLIVLCALATLVTCVGLVMRRGQSEVTGASQQALNWWTIGLALVGLAWLIFAVRYMAGGQARYWNPALLPLALYAVMGWRSFWENIGGEKALRVVTFIMGAALVWLTVWNISVWRTLV